MIAVIAWLEVCVESLLESSGNIVVIKSEWEFSCFAELRGRVAGIRLANQSIQLLAGI